MDPPTIRCSVDSFQNRGVLPCAGIHDIQCSPSKQPARRGQYNKLRRLSGFLGFPSNWVIVPSEDPSSPGTPPAGRESIFCTKDQYFARLAMFAPNKYNWTAQMRQHHFPYNDERTKYVYNLVWRNIKQQHIKMLFYIKDCWAVFAIFSIFTQTNVRPTQPFIAVSGFHKRHCCFSSIIPFCRQVLCWHTVTRVNWGTKQLYHPAKTFMETVLQDIPVVEMVSSILLLPLSLSLAS